MCIFSKRIISSAIIDVINHHLCLSQILKFVHSGNTSSVIHGKAMASEQNLTQDCQLLDRNFVETFAPTWVLIITIIGITSNSLTLIAIPFAAKRKRCTEISICIMYFKKIKNI